MPCGPGGPRGPWKPINLRPVSAQWRWIRLQDVSKTIFWNLNNLIFWIETLGSQNFKFRFLCVLSIGFQLVRRKLITGIMVSCPICTVHWSWFPADGDNDSGDCSVIGRFTSTDRRRIRVCATLLLSHFSVFKKMWHFPTVQFLYIIIGILMHNFKNLQRWNDKSADKHYC